MSAELRREIEALFSAFLSAELALRFSGLPAMKPTRWTKIDPWRIWESLPNDPRIIPWSQETTALLQSELFASRANELATVLRCGHDTPRLERQRLCEALGSTPPVLEGFISVIPGKLGIAINHDGQACILRN